MSIKSQKSGTTFHGVHSVTGASPKQFGAYIRRAAEQLSMTPTAPMIAQGLGTIDAEGGMDGSLWSNNPDHPGPWGLGSWAGSLADRMDPWKSTLLSMRKYKEDGKTFQTTWWQFEQQQGEIETGQDRASKFMRVAQEVLGLPAGAFPGSTVTQLSGVPGLEQAEEGINAVTGAISSSEDFLSEVFHILTDFRRLGQLAAEATAWFIKLIAKAIWDYVIAPVLHWTERAVSYYWVNFFGTGTEQGSGFGYVLRQNAGTITILFWATGYAILWNDGSGSALVEPHESILGQGIKGIEGAIARRKLIKPKDVKKETPTKPKPKISTVPIERQDTFSVARKRPITVTGKQHEGRARQHASRRGRFTPSPIPRPGQKTETRPAERKKLVVPDGYSRKAQKPPTKKPAKQSKSRVGT